MFPYLLVLTLLSAVQGDPVPQQVVDEPASLVPTWEQTHGVPPIRWTGNRIDAARQEAEDRQVPILLWILRDKEPASEAWASQKILDKSYIELLEQETVPAIVWLAGKDGIRHSEERVRDSRDAKPRWRCPLLRTCRCEDHNDSEKLLKGIDIPDLLPAAFFISHQGELIGQLAQEVPFQDTEDLKKALNARAAPVRATRLNLQFIEIHLERADKHFTDGEHTKGSRELVRAKRILDKFGPRLHTRWEQSCRPYLGYGKQMLLRARKIGRIDPARRIKLLLSISEELSGLPPGDTAVAMLKRDLRIPRKD